MSSITYACGHKDTLTVKPSPQRRRAMRKCICHNCYVYANVHSRLTYPA